MHLPRIIGDSCDLVAGYMVTPLCPVFVLAEFLEVLGVDINYSKHIFGN